MAKIKFTGYYEVILDENFVANGDIYFNKMTNTNFYPKQCGVHLIDKSGRAVRELSETEISQYGMSLKQDFIMTVL
jgi:hypothetical protein